MAWTFWTCTRRHMILWWQGKADSTFHWCLAGWYAGQKYYSKYCTKCLHIVHIHYSLHIWHIWHIQQFDQWTCQCEPAPSCHRCPAGVLEFLRTDLPFAPKNMRARQQEITSGASGDGLLERGEWGVVDGSVVEWDEDGSNLCPDPNATKYESVRKECGAHLLYNAFWKIKHFCVQQIAPRRNARVQPWCSNSTYHCHTLEILLLCWEGDGYGRSGFSKNGGTIEHVVGTSEGSAPRQNHNSFF